VNVARDSVAVLAERAGATPGRRPEPGRPAVPAGGSLPPALRCLGREGSTAEIAVDRSRRLLPRGIVATRQPDRAVRSVRTARERPCSPAPRRFKPGARLPPEPWPLFRPLRGAARDGLRRRGRRGEVVILVGQHMDFEPGIATAPGVVQPNRERPARGLP
jgi:hypothetical protein